MRAVSGGRSVCSYLKQGHSQGEVVALGMRENPGLSPMDVIHAVTDAVLAFCPEMNRRCGDVMQLILPLLAAVFAARSAWVLTAGARDGGCWYGRWEVTGAPRRRGDRAAPARRSDLRLSRSAAARSCPGRDNYLGVYGS